MGRVADVSTFKKMSFLFNVLSNIFDLKLNLANKLYSSFFKSGFLFFIKASHIINKQIKPLICHFQV